MRICLTSSARRLLFAMVLIWMVVHGGRDARVSAQIGTGGTDEWTTYGGDLASRRYRPFDQINATTFKDLEVAWRFKTDALGARPEFNFEATPLMVGGVALHHRRHATSRRRPRCGHGRAALDPPRGRGQAR